VPLQTPVSNGPPALIVKVTLPVSQRLDLSYQRILPVALPPRKRPSIE